MRQEGGALPSTPVNWASTDIHEIGMLLLGAPRTNDTQDRLEATEAEKANIPNEMEDQEHILPKAVFGEADHPPDRYAGGLVKGLDVRRGGVGELVAEEGGA